MKASSKSTLRESFLIVFSVLLALGLSNLVTQYQTNKKARVALLSIKSEIENNFKIIKWWESEHIAIRDKLQLMANNPNDSLKLKFETAKFFNLGLLTGNKPLVEAFLAKTAWETANSTGILSEFDFETAQTISNAYSMQSAITDHTIQSILDLFYDSNTHEMDKLDQTIIQFLLRFYELTGQERTIQEIYEAAILHIESL